MLYQPFTNAQTLLALTNQASGNRDENYLIIQPNPLLNPLTYCVSNRDIVSLMKKSSRKNFSASILAKTKKSKQSVRKPAGNSQQGASAKVRKATTQAKNAALPPQTSAKTMPAKQAKKHISKQTVREHLSSKTPIKGQTALKRKITKQKLE